MEEPTPNYWNKFHRKSTRDLFETLENRLNETKYLRSYMFSSFDNLCRRYLPKVGGLKLLEIGSAPGRRLIYFHKEFKYEPFGIDCSAEGIRRNRENFLIHGLKLENIFCGDAFGPCFQSKYRSHFDVVASFGLVEHFEDPRKLIEQHANLLKELGYLVISIPNFRGINYYCQRMLDRKALEGHNFDLMKLERFKKSFANLAIRTLFCGYFGTWNFASFRCRKEFMVQCIFYTFLGAQVVMNPLMHLCLGNRGFDCRHWSPHLIFIGRKE